MSLAWAKNSGPVKFNFKHFLFSSPNSENDQKYEYFTLLDKNISLFDRAACCSEENSHKSKDIMLHKSIKYSYFWSFSDFGEENKKCLKLNFKGPEFLRARSAKQKSSSTCHF